MKRVIFDGNAFEDFTDWSVRDKKTYNKIVTLIKDILRSPFTGLGKPEPLRHMSYLSNGGIRVCNG